MAEPRPRAKRIGWEWALLVLAVLGAVIVSIRPGALAARRSSVADRQDARKDSQSLATVNPVVREHIPFPLGAEAARAMHEQCALQAMAHGGYFDPDSATTAVVVADSFGVRSALSGRPDSAVYEGTVAGANALLYTWHCTVPANWDPARLSQVQSDGELPWSGTQPRFELVRALADAAAKECATRAFRLFREYDLRAQRRSRSGDTLVVTGDAFPLNSDDLVRAYRCKAVIRRGAIGSLTVEEVK